MVWELEHISEDNFDDTKHLTRAQQHLLFILRVNGDIQGFKSQKQYKSIRFYECIKLLIQAGWVEKKTKLNNIGQPTAIYSLSKDGHQFVRMLGHFPPYLPIYDKFKRTFSYG